MKNLLQKNNTVTMLCSPLMFFIACQNEGPRRESRRKTSESVIAKVFRKELVTLLQEIQPTLMYAATTSL